MFVSHQTSQSPPFFFHGQWKFLHCFLSNFQSKGLHFHKVLTQLISPPYLKKVDIIGMSMKIIFFPSRVLNNRTSNLSFFYHYEEYVSFQLYNFGSMNQKISNLVEFNHISSFPIIFVVYLNRYFLFQLIQVFLLKDFVL